MPYIEIRITKPVNLKQKRALAKNVTEAVVKSLGCEPHTVGIELQEVPQENTNHR
jgi:4-oxalocrotonate tautomerase family enzyme